MHGFEGEGQPARTSLWSQSEQPAPNARSLSGSPPSERKSGVGGEPGPFALLACFGGEPGGEQEGKINKARTRNLHFLAQSIFEGLETGTRGGARTQREKGCLQMIR